ncbi:MAG: response regulator transcription factor [Bifidobacteriaceae bacterium]|jgi:two-component system OmpR family response regulator|nr:response regulator transcription factor [Bifidobacteriaceae bacterium]
MCENSYKILLLDDEKLLRETVAEALTLAGFSVSAFARAHDALKAVAKSQEENFLDLENVSNAEYDAAVLDVMVPDMDGFTLGEKLKEYNPELPIIFLTARDKVDDKLKGFEIGADDYLVKPFVMQELVARLNAIISRTKTSKSNVKLNAKINQNKVLQIADLKLDLQSLTASRYSDKAGELPIELTKTEFRLLQFLVENAKIVLSKDDIMAEIWDQEYTDDYSILDAYISHLRKKIDSFANLPKLIYTKWGVGYYISH